MDCFQLLKEVASWVVLASPEVAASEAVASWAVLASEVAARREAGRLAWVDQLE